MPENVFARATATYGFQLPYRTVGDIIRNNNFVANDAEVTEAALFGADGERWSTQEKTYMWTLYLAQTYNLLYLQNVGYEPIASIISTDLTYVPVTKKPINTELF